MTNTTLNTTPDMQISVAATSGEDVPQSQDYTAPLQSTPALVKAVTAKKQWLFCGDNFHHHFKYPAGNSECNICSKAGYWAKACQSRQKQTVAVVLKNNELCAVLHTVEHFPQSLSK